MKTSLLKRLIYFVSIFILFFQALSPASGSVWAAGAHPVDQAPTWQEQTLQPLVVYANRRDVLPSLQVLADGQEKQSIQPDGVPVELSENYPLPKVFSQPPIQPEAPTRPIIDSPTIPQAMPAPLQSFEGVNNLFGGWPPDTQGDIGPNHYLQWINLHFAVYQIDKINHTATKILGPLPGNTFWQGLSSTCATTNDGDPIALYDPFANRWFVSQFALPFYPNGPFYQCVAVSQTPDPTGAWHRYEFQIPVNKMNDYPKFGVWPDAYYMTVNQFNPNGSWGGAGVAALERSAMLSGLPARMVYFDLYNVDNNFGGMLPADFDGTFNPPLNAPGLFAEWDDAAWIPSQDALRLWEFRVNWTNPALSTFGVNGQPNAIIPTLNVNPDLCSYNRSCIPQPATIMKLDAISDRLMYRLQYRNFGTHESLVSNHTVDYDSTDRAGIHWFELRRQGGAWTMYNEGVYSPDATHRWMGSAALDHVGNLALGYSASSSTIYPSVRYAGRLVTDPPGTLPQGEQSLVAGTGSQTGESRWGDYSMMGVDPSDDCTFWYTQEYVKTTGSNTWTTRIGSFRFPSCSLGASGLLSGQVTESGSGVAIEGATVQAVSSTQLTFNTLTSSSGTYSLQLPADVYTVTVSAYGYLGESVSGVVISADQTTVVDFVLETAPRYTVSGVVRDARTGWPLYASLAISGAPLEPVWTDPVTGAYQVELPGDQTFQFNVQAFVEGYLPAALDVGPLNGNLNLDVELQPDAVACAAPGYQMVGGECQPTPGGLIVGVVYSASTLEGLAGAVLRSDNGTEASTVATPNDEAVLDGFYTIFSPSGSHVLTATMIGGYAPLSTTVSVPLSGTVGQDFALLSGHLTYSPEDFSVAVEIGQATTATLTLSNTGGILADFELVEVEWSGSGDLPWGSFEPSQYVLKPFRQNMVSTEGLKLPDSPDASLLAGGQVLRSWIAYATQDPWSVAFDPLNLMVWLNSPAPSWYGEDRMEQYTPEGLFTGLGTAHAMDHVYGPADLAVQWGTGQIWVMNVNPGVANCIFEFNPDGAYTGHSICPGGPTGFSTSQRGLAYDPVTDTWFAGGWNDLMVYRFDGQGNILSSKYVGLRISGLAYNPQTQHLFAMVNAASTRVYVLDVANNYNSLGYFTISSGFGGYAGAGLEFDCEGNLWAVDQNTSTVYQFQSGETAALCNYDVPWLSLDVSSGQLEAGAHQQITLTFDAGVPEITQPGEYYAQLKVRHNTPHSVTRIPITLTVLPLSHKVALSADQGLTGIPGETIIYSLQVTNLGPEDSINLSLGLHQWVSTLSTSLIGPLATGESAEVQVAVKVPTDALPGDWDQVTLTATSVGDPTKSDDAVLTSTAEAALADLEVVKQAAEGEYHTGDVITYTIAITNYGPTRAAGVTVVDLLPVPVEVVQVPEGCNVSGRLVSCELGLLEIGEQRSLTIVVRLGDVGLLVNHAWVLALTDDPARLNNWASSGVQVFGLIYFIPLVAK